MNAAERVARIREALLEEGIDAWLLFDFHGSNPVARSALGMDGGPAASSKNTRRWLYLVPARGEPRKLVHRIEPGSLDHLPGSAAVYLTYGEFDAGIAALVKHAAEARRERPSPAGRRAAAPEESPAIAMEYSPSARLPYVSRVDAGTVELVRAAGGRVVSSADLAQRFDGALDPDARREHVRTGAILHGIIRDAFARAARERGALTEVSLQTYLLERLSGAGLVSSDPPTVAVNRHSADPHFTTRPATDVAIGPGDFLLIDAWAKGAAPGSVYADYTQVAWLGPSAPRRHREVFDVVREARDAAVARVREAVAAGAPVRGCDVDDTARRIVRERGYGERFVHRLGHSIGREVHGNGVHLDNLETRDERRLIDGTLVSVEPGVYLDDFGVRSEVNVLIDGGQVVVTPEDVQREILALLP